MTEPATERHQDLIYRFTGHIPDAFTDFELLTLAFGALVPVAQAEDRAREYERELGPAGTIQFLDFMELTFFKGIGDAKAAGILAAVELGRRAQLNSVQKTATMKSTGSVPIIDLI
jgi:DNA repair protein RadC